MKARNPSTGNLEEVYVKALDSLPVGIILSFPTTSSAELPNGYMFCDGSTISRTTYSELFSLIGTSYGAGDGSTTFNLPNLKGRVQVGRDSTQTEFDTIGETGGSKGLQQHSHILSIGDGNLVAGGSAGQNANISLGGSGYNTYNNPSTETAGTGNSGNLQPYIVSNFIIKVKQTVPLAASVLNANSNSTKDTYSCDYINNLHNYSSEEHIIGTFNNKPLYRKSFKVLVTSQIFEFNHGITNMDDLVEYNASIIQQGGYKYPIPYYSEVAGYTIEGGVSSTGCYFKLGNSINYNQYVTVVLEYTKTTD